MIHHGFLFYQEGGFMMKKEANFNYEIVEVLGVLTQSNDEQEHLSWCKGILETLLTNDNEQLSGIDIRTFNQDTMQLGGKGLRLTKEEANRAVNILLQKGYGDFDILESEYKKRCELFSENEHTES